MPSCSGRRAASHRHDRPDPSSPSDDRHLPPLSPPSRASSPRRIPARDAARRTLTGEPGTVGRSRSSAPEDGLPLRAVRRARVASSPSTSRHRWSRRSTPASARRRRARPAEAVARAHADGTLSATPTRRPRRARRTWSSLRPVMLDDEQQPDYRHDAAVGSTPGSTRARRSSSRRPFRSATRVTVSRRASSTRPASRRRRTSSSRSPRSGCTPVTRSRTSRSTRSSSAGSGTSPAAGQPRSMRASSTLRSLR
jgi:hypothetical protein